MRACLRRWVGSGRTAWMVSFSFCPCRLREPLDEPGAENILVPKKGLEPPHPCGYMDLNHARLPIPPLRRGKPTSEEPNSLRWREFHCTSATSSWPSVLAGLTGCRIGFAVVSDPLLAILLQLIMQSLEADPENLGSSSLIIVCRLKRFED